MKLTCKLSVIALRIVMTKWRHDTVCFAISEEQDSMTLAQAKYRSRGVCNRKCLAEHENDKVENQAFKCFILEHLIF